jgi:protein-serine/threonine kinase
LLTEARCAPPIGDDTRHSPEALARQRLAPALQIPKNRSTGNLGIMGDNSEKARVRFSFDAGAAAAEYDSMSRLA